MSGIWHLTIPLTMSEHMFDDRLCPGSPLRAAERGSGTGSCCCGRRRWRLSRGASRRSARSRGRRRGSGCTPGMALGEALARCPELVLVAPDPERAESAWEELLAGSRGSAPRWSPSAPGRRSSPPTGSAGCGAGGVEDVIARARRAAGMPARLGAAPTRFAAYAAAARARPRARRRSRAAARAARAADRLGGRAAALPLPAARRAAAAAARARVAAARDAGAARDPHARRAGGAAARRGRRPLRNEGPAGVDACQRRRRARCARARRARGCAESLELPEAASGPQLERALALLVDRLLATPPGAGARCGGCGSPRGSPAAGAGASSCRCARRAPRPSGCCWRWRRSSSELPGPARAARADGALARPRGAPPAAAGPRRARAPARPARRGDPPGAGGGRARRGPARARGRSRLAGPRAPRLADAVPRAAIRMSGRMTGVYWPQPVEVESGADGVPVAVGTVAVEAVREEWLVEDRWWTPRPLSPPLLRARAGRRAQRRRLPRAGGRRALVRAARLRAGRWATSSCTATPPSRSSTARRSRPSWPRRRPSSAIRARAHRPRRALGLDGVRARLQGARGAADHGRRADGLDPRDAAARRRRARQLPAGRFHLTLLVESRAGYRNLCRLLTEAHRGTRERPDRDPLPPAVALAELERARRGAGLPVGMRARRGARGALGARRREAGPRRWGGGWRRRSGASASGSSCSGRCGAATGRATAGSPSSPSGSASTCVATGNVHAHDRSRAALQDALVAVRLQRDARRVRAAAARQRGRRCSRRRRRWRRASPTTRERGGRERRAGRAAGVRPHARPRLPLSGRRRPRRRPHAGRDLPRAARAPLRGDAPSAPRPSAGSTRSWRVIRTLRLSGFFLLHYDLLELAREVAVEVRGPDSARALLPPGAGPGVERQLGRLLPDRALARGPGPRRALPGALPQRGDHRRARHRPRLPARHPREADPARPRALRARALGAGRGVRDLPVARRGARPRQGAGPAAGRDRARGAAGRRLRARRGGRARHRRGDRARGARALDALAGAGAAGGARPTGCRATPRSIRAGWCSRPSR